MAGKQRNFFDLRTWRAFASPPEQGVDVDGADLRERSHPVWASRWLFLIVFCVGAVLRLSIAVQDQLIHVDGAFQYIPAARAYYEGGLKAGVECIQMPLFPLLTALLAHPLGGNLEAAARVISLLAGILAMIPLYLLGRSLFGYRVGIASTAIFAVSSLTVRNSSEVAKESLFALLFLTGLWLGWLAMKRLRWFWCVAAGALGALTYLCRPDGIDLFLLWGIWLGVGVFRYLRRDWRKSLVRIGAGLIIAGSGVLVAGPYVRAINLGREPGESFRLSQKKPLDEVIDDGTVKSNVIPEAAPFINRVGTGVGRAGAALGEIGREFFNELTVGLFGFMMIGLVYRALKLVVGKDRYLMLVCFIQLGVCYLIARNMSEYDGIRLVASNFSGRHLLSMLLAAWFWMGWGFVAVEAGVVRLVHAVHVRRGTAWGAARRDDVRVGLLMLALLLVMGSAAAYDVPHADKLPRKTAGLWLSEQAWSKDARIITNARRIAYYAGLKRQGNIRRLPAYALHRVNDLVEFARTYNYGYIALIGDEIDEGAAAQIAEAVAQGKLEFLYRTDEEPDEDIHVYRVLPARTP